MKLVLTVVEGPRGRRWKEQREEEGGPWQEVSLQGEGWGEEGWQLKWEFGIFPCGESRRRQENEHSVTKQSRRRGGVQEREIVLNVIEIWFPEG